MCIRDRCRPEYLSQLADDLIWLGLDWDLGWRPGETAYCQSCRTPFYQMCIRDRIMRDSLGPLGPPTLPFWPHKLSSLTG